VVIHFSCDYQMVIDTLQFLRSSAAITVISVPIVYPVVDESQLIDAFQSELDNHSHVTMCIYSHISSMVSCATACTSLLLYGVLLRCSLRCLALHDAPSPAVDGHR
jgi:hypothetical protein